MSLHALKDVVSQATCFQRVVIDFRPMITQAAYKISWPVG
jgi:hypothetical protein